MLALVLLMCAGCSKGEVSKLVSRFQTACNDSDIDAILDCIVPSIANPIKSVRELFGDSTTLDTILDYAAGIGNADEVTKESLASLRIKPDNYTFNDDKTECMVTATLSYQLPNKKVSRIITINCVNTDDAWFIESIDF